MNILGFHKLSLVDYPKELCSIIFTGGCNFHCPYCHNKDIVNKKMDPIDEEVLEKTLLNRKKYVSSLCISGGEPTLQNDLMAFIQKYRGHGFKIKLDTNGSNPGVLKKLLDNKLLDYVAMDIKTDILHYEDITDISGYEEQVLASIELLKNSYIDYEFRTTFVKELMTRESIKGLKELVQDSNRFVLQTVKLDGEVLCTDVQMSSFTRAEMEGLKDEFTPIVKDIRLNI